MKRKSGLVAALVVAMAGMWHGGAQALPSANVTDANGRTVNAATFNNGGQPYVIVFWSTTCSPCQRQLDAINQQRAAYPGLKVIAVSIDTVAAAPQSFSAARSRGWAFDLYSDPNQDLKRAMGVQSVPYAGLVDGSGTVVWSANTYAPGDEAGLLDRFEQLQNGEPID